MGQEFLMAQARAQTDTLIGEVLASRYRVEHRLGEGAMGVVYKARHVKVGRPFAVKVLHPNLLTDSKIEQRFEREAELAGRLRHPNVIGVVDVGETAEGFRYMVMDYVEGKDLAALLVEAPMPPPRIIRLVRQMLEGLYHAHQQGLIHRDFKPENVIVEKDTHGDEVPRIVDFGIAILREGGDSPDSPGRLTTNGLVLGTPHYMAPEQAVADPVDHRIDLFAMGIVVYEMLSGRLPFDGTGAEVARANLMLDPPPISKRVPYLEVDPLLEAYARKLMAKSRDLRPPTAKAARDLLDLIERDRTAAAAALGVPVEVGTRPPAVTAPVVSRPAVSESLPPISEPTAAPPPVSGPAMPAVVAVPERAAAPPTVAERDITTDELPRRRYGLAIIAGAVSIAVVAVLAIVVTGGSRDDKLASNDKANVTPAAELKPDDPAKSGVDTSKSGADSSKSSTDSSKAAADSSTPGADPSKSGVESSKPGTDSAKPGLDTSKPGVDALTNGASKPGADGSKPTNDTSRQTHGTSKSGTSKPSLVDKSRTRVDGKKPGTPEVKPPGQTADVKPEVKPEVKPPDPKPEVKPAEPKPPEAKPALTPASVHVLFAQVGGELIAIKNAKPGLIDDLYAQYRNIQIDQDAAPPNTEKTAATLNRLRAAAKERNH
jgi:serine/threonine protein kinase